MLRLTRACGHPPHPPSLAKGDNSALGSWCSLRPHIPSVRNYGWNLQHAHFTPLTLPSPWHKPRVFHQNQIKNRLESCLLGPTLASSIHQPFLSKSICLSIYLSVPLYLSIYHLSIHPSICQSSTYNNSFTSSLSIWISFLSFSCLIAVARTSNTMLNRRNESSHTCLFSRF